MTDYVKIFENPSDPRLGRNVRHDPRSWAYAVTAVDIGTCIWPAPGRNGIVHIDVMY